MRKIIGEVGQTLKRAYALMLPMPLARSAPEAGTAAILILAVLWLGFIAIGDVFFARASIEFTKWGVVGWGGIVPLFVCMLMILGRPWPAVWLRRAIADSFGICAIAAFIWCAIAACVFFFASDDTASGMDSHPVWAAAKTVLFLLWPLAALARAGLALPSPQRARAGLRIVTAMAVPLLLIPLDPFFQGDFTRWNKIDAWYWQAKLAQMLEGPKPAAKQEEEYTPAFVAEDLFYRQPSLLTGTLGGLMPSDGKTPKFFFIAAAPYGGQDVFAHEVTAAKAIFDERFGTTGRSAILSNSPATLDTVPLASMKNINVTLTEIGKLMDRERDVLVLFITSHGAKGIIAEDLEGVDLAPITPDGLASALETAGIRNRVLILSACHSGSFIPRLANDDTLIMTAASAERTSFGCGNGRDWTFFGDALFNNALRQEADFVKAFAIAEKLIRQWEFWRFYLKPSEPQLSVGKRIAQKLEAIEAVRHSEQSQLTP